MPKIKLYVDLLSQPCRALYIFIQLNKIPFEIFEISIKEGEQLANSYKAINPLRKLPSISDKGFNLSESMAIFRYLEREYEIDDHWYPKNSKQRALIDDYLEWHHLNTRLCQRYFKIKHMKVILNKKPPDQEKLHDITIQLENCLNAIENIWLNRGNYIVGHKISIADIFASCEIEQLRVVDFNPFSGRPKLKKWLKNVRNETYPFYEEAHKRLNIIKKASTSDLSM